MKYGNDDDCCCLIAPVEFLAAFTHDVRNHKQQTMIMTQLFIFSSKTTLRCCAAFVDDVKVMHGLRRINEGLLLTDLLNVSCSTRCVEKQCSLIDNCFSVRNKIFSLVEFKK